MPLADLLPMFSTPAARSFNALPTAGPIIPAQLEGQPTSLQAYDPASYLAANFPQFYTPPPTPQPIVLAYSRSAAATFTPAPAPAPAAPTAQPPATQTPTDEAQTDQSLLSVPGAVTAVVGAAKAVGGAAGYTVDLSQVEADVKEAGKVAAYFAVGVILFLLGLWTLIK